MSNASDAQRFDLGNTVGARLKRPFGKHAIDFSAPKALVGRDGFPSPRCHVAIEAAFATCSKGLACFCHSGFFCHEGSKGGPCVRLEALGPGTDEGTVFLFTPSFGQMAEKRLTRARKSRFTHAG